MVTINRRMAWALALVAVLVVAIYAVIRSSGGRDARIHGGASDHAETDLGVDAISAESVRAPAPGEDAVRRSSVERASNGGARVTMCVFPDGAAPVGTKWTLERTDANGDSVGFRVEASAQFLRVPPGAWRVVAETDGWIAIDRELELVADQRAVVWVGRCRALRVRVGDPDGRPIAGASVAWLPLHLDRASEWTRTPSVAEVTDVTGAAFLDSVGVVAGELHVHADGFVPSRRALIDSGADPDSLLEVPVTLDRAERGGVTLRVLDATTTLPLAGARLWAPPHVVAESQSDGSLLLPAHIDDEAELAVDAPHHARVRCLARDLRAKRAISLYELGELRVEVLHANGAPARDVLVWAETNLERVESDFLPDLELCEVRAEERVSLEAPVGLALEVFACGAEGQSARAGVTLASGLTQLRLLLQDGDPLRLEIVDADGRELEATVEVQYSGPSPRNARRSGARVAIPLAERLAQVLVFAPGRVPARFHPVAGASSHSGDLRVTLDRAHEARVRTVDGSGVPLTGLCVRAWAEVDHKAIAEHPTLNGGVPTTHPGWSRHSPPARKDWTDSQGWCTLAGLVEGAYRLHANVDNKFQILGVADLQPYLERWISIPVDREILWEIEALHLWEIHARDSASGREVVDLTVKLTRGGGVTTQTSSGTAWLGWIPASVETVQVSSAHHREAKLVLDEDLHPGRVATVELIAGGEVELSLTGGPGTQHERKLTFRVFERRAGYSTQITAGAFSAPSHGWVRLAAPFGPALWIELEPIVLDGVVWEFEPRSAPLDAGAVSFTWIRR